jgi:hypothetical protein
VKIFGRREKMKELAIDIYEFCQKNNLWDDNIIYFDGIAWSSSPTWSGENGKKIAEDLYEYEDRDPLTYIKYSNPDTINMSFEGSLCSVLNGYMSGYTKLEREFSNLFKKYGLYYEMGYHWSLAAYRI